MTANVTFYIDDSPTPGGSPCTKVGVFWWLGAVGTDTTLWDLDLYANGFWRAKLTPLAHYVVEATLLGASFSVDLGPVPQFQWVWLTAGWAPTSPGGLGMSSAIYLPGGTLVTRNWAGGVILSGNTSVAIPATLGEGKSLTSTYADMQDFYLFRRSKLYLAAFADNGATPPYQHMLLPPTSDADLTGGAGVQEYYTGNQAIGSAATIDDGSVALAHIVAAPSLTIWSDGPF